MNVDPRSPPYTGSLSQNIGTSPKETDFLLSSLKDEKVIKEDSKAMTYSKIAGLRVGQVLSGFVGVSLFILTGSLGLLVGFVVGAINAKRISSTPLIRDENAEAIIEQMKKEEILKGMKYGAIGLFVLVSMAGEKARLLNIELKDRSPSEPERRAEYLDSDT